MRSNVYSVMPGRIPYTGNIVKTKCDQIQLKLSPDRLMYAANIDKLFVPGESYSVYLTIFGNEWVCSYTKISCMFVWSFTGCCLRRYLSYRTCPMCSDSSVKVVF